MLVASAQMLAGQLMLEGDPGIVYWRAGDPTSERIVIVLHGGPAMSHEYLRPEWDTLAALGQVIYYDQRGCGASGRATSYSWEDHVADLGRLIAYVSPDRPVVLAGSSWGASLAYLYSTVHPGDVQALILSGFPALRRWRSNYRFMPDLEVPSSIDPLTPTDLTRFDSQSLFDRRPRRASGSLLEPKANNTRAAEEKARVSALMESRFVADCPEVRVQTFESMATAPPAPEFESSPVPVLFFPDNVFGLDFAESSEVPKVSGNMTTIVSGGHDPWFEYPDAFFDAVRDFLTDVWMR